MVSDKKTEDMYVLEIECRFKISRKLLHFNEVRGKSGVDLLDCVFGREIVLPGEQEWKVPGGATAGWVQSSELQQLHVVRERAGDPQVGLHQGPPTRQGLRPQLSRTPHSLTAPKRIIPFKRSITSANSLTHKPFHKSPSTLISKIFLPFSTTFS